MDPLDILGNLHKIKPAFQPIVSAINHGVIGHEVLARYEGDGEWHSLGPFFHDPDVPEEFKVEVDQHILKLAIEEMLESGTEGLLFINRNAKQLMINDGDDLLQSLLVFAQKGFDMERIVIEVTEHDFDEDFESLNHLLLYYKTYGIQIAVDHIGAKSSNIDRIRLLEPHILKIDTGIIRKQNGDLFHDIMYSMSMLAHRIGAALLFENIEDDYQLHFAWKHGSRYYQGFYLGKPKFKPVDHQSLAINIGEKMAGYVQREKGLLEQRHDFIRKWESKVKGLLSKWEGPKKADAFIEGVTQEFHEESFRMFICHIDGQQVSSNFRKKEEIWELEPYKRGSNWAFRPYFLESVMQMKALHTGLLSDLYSDIETKEMVRTFSFPLTDQHFLFIDLRYAYLYEHECLLA
ncbi:EAL domain, c-di-GMP-specific phosphodiesterase class I (or its enzymatically inactive variant) [Halobacillus karajensis]|uniref:EAL-domain containing protein YkuI n=1 Tax=Halobacillus karajensis TaxID=195088 RepID=A0A024P2L7_9BACI|nr:EAL domain-containing protein [Halobacillus karajensis]CDQ19394.1 putative EAL-domain containing protein YkuI [Halobacillus karajensis]CDQ21857.1 putative EAL-domain containing protein YkuI [Halobacillus karajensis]CDQ27697.1 putative EAL-domain containing protein YkuI [Halobacillus karajensis]SEH83295.1 EAL domain, c-di-GMP-specific phosphodiesterase class I (or its enzymatically inactive variant) [Halobacillus karajensis]